MEGGPRRLTLLALLPLAASTGAAFVTPESAAAAPATYYVSASGNDSNPGTSPTAAWRTLGPANARNLAGDTVLLQGGSTFTGPFALDSNDAGVTIGSFGSGRARIVAHGSSGVLAYDTSDITVRDLVLVGDGASFANDPGVDVYSDEAAGQRLSGVAISNLRAEGFKDGIAIGGANPGAGFAQVSISGVKAIGNRDAGVITYGPAFNAAHPSYANAGVNVVRTVANRNLGNPADRVHNSGNGIVLGSVDGGSITNSSASGNGLRCAAPEGAAGIWTYDSRDIHVAYDTATGNRTGGSADGDGFDLDQNVSNSYLEHNTSSDNDGAGYLVFTARNNAANYGNVVRWNTSRGDARKNSWYGGITLAGKVASVRVTNNFVDTTASPSRAPALAVKAGVTGATIHANTLKSAT